MEKLTKEQRIKLYTNMVRARKLDEYYVESFNTGKLTGFFHSGQGQEAIGIGAITFLRADDYMYHTHRGHGITEVLAKGRSMTEFLAGPYGRATEECAVDEYILPLGGTVGGDLTTGSGVAFACKQNGNQQVVMQGMGDGMCAHSTLHTSCLMSMYWQLPQIFLCSNNTMAMWVPTEMVHKRENLADLVYGYGMPSTVVDGQDVEAVYYAVQEAVDRARAGEGPTFIECKTNRFRSHSEGRDDRSHTSVRDEKEVEDWRQNRDPIELYREKLLKEQVLSASDFSRIDSEVAAEVAEAEEAVLARPEPSVINPENMVESIYVD